MRRALVETTTGKVLNVIAIEKGAKWQLPKGCILVNADNAGGTGDTWDGKMFIPAPEPEPTGPSLEDRVKALEGKAAIVRL